MITSMRPSVLRSHRVLRRATAIAWIVALALVASCGSEEDMTDREPSTTGPPATEPASARETVPPTSTPRESFDPADATPIEGTRWTLTGTIEAGGTYAVPAGVGAWIQIEDGTLTGSGGCNRIRGQATVTPPADRPGAEGIIDVGPLVSTRMACEGDSDQVERHVLQVLHGEVRSFVALSTLVLERDDGLGLVFEAVDQAPARCDDTAPREATGDAARSCASPSGPGSPNDPASSDGTPETTVPSDADNGGSGGSSGSSSGSPRTTVPMSDDPTSGRGLERPTAPPLEPKVPRPAD
jgi:META domain